MTIGYLVKHQDGQTYRVVRILKHDQVELASITWPGWNIITSPNSTKLTLLHKTLESK